MVDKKRLEQKLPVILTNGTTTPENFNEYRRQAYHLKQLKKKDPTLYNSRISAIVSALASLEEEVKIEWGPRVADQEFQRLRQKNKWL
jgi:hypothetical protein